MTEAGGHGERARPRRNKKKLTSILVLSLEDELRDMMLAEEATAAVETRMKEIVAELFPDDPSSGERYFAAFKKRQRSSADFVEYCVQQDHLWAAIARVSAQKHRANLEKISGDRDQLDDKSIRNMAMAREFLRRKRNFQGSASSLQEKIGREKGLKRSAAIEAINRGLKLLPAQEPVKDDSLPKAPDS